MSIRHRLWAWYVKQSNHIAKLRIERLLANLFCINRVRVSQHDRFVMEMPALDVLSENLIRRGNFEQATLERILHLMENGRCFADIGAHYGFFALAVAASLADDGRVIALEPAPGNYIELAKNVALNRATCICPILAAASDKTTLVGLSKPGYAGNTTTIYVTPEVEGGSITVPAFRLSDLFDLLRLDNVDVIKIDVEGHESAVLDGLFCDGASRPRHVVFEYIPDVFPMANNALNLLECKGYIIKQVDGTPYVRNVRPLENNLWASLC
jgi:FkbM family methyltransferase